jgi:peptidoglycan/xylan/chitin deacetylase (PgdA/CDA1 family)
MYHRIVPKAEAGNSLPSMVVSPEHFRSQLDALHRSGWKTMTLERLAAAMRSGMPVSPRTFAITIDDGWNDGYNHAFPIMREYGYDATFFVITNRIGAAGFLSKRQLLDLQAAGNEIGNHTMSHANLTTLNYESAVAEIEGGSAALARTIGHRPVSFSYPKSGVEPWVVAAARECPGLEIAVTTVIGTTQSWRSRFEAPRVKADADVSGAALLAELEGNR